jgi:hypothetical protein
MAYSFLTETFMLLHSAGYFYREHHIGFLYNIDNTFTDINESKNQINACVKV